MDDLLKTMRISAAGMKAQGTRLRVISENVANVDSMPSSPGEEPYRRKIVTFKNELDRAIGMDTVRVDRIQQSQGEFKKRFDPSHPAAGPDGYVLAPNINTLIEMTDLREAQRSYEANLSAIKASKSMLQRTIGLLR